MARGILIQSPSDDDVVVPNVSFAFPVEGHVMPADTPVTLTLYHGLVRKFDQVDATIDSMDHTKWTHTFTVDDDGDYVLIATQRDHTNIVHSVSFNVTRPT